VKNQIKSFKNRHIDFDKSVDVYRNINNRNAIVYSLRQKGLVVGHATQLNLRDCEFHVNKNGQRRVRREKVKNVHAWIKGKISKPNRKPEYIICYNPYQFDNFIAYILPCAKPLNVCKASKVVINQRGVFGHGII
jgi:hypothetical protein